MAFVEGGGEEPRDELEPVRQAPITPGEQERSHAVLVAAFRQAIRLKRQEGSNPREPELGGRAQNYSAARIRLSRNSRGNGSKLTFSSC
jgi:hypothetical protein